MNDPATIRRLYGRRQGHKLRQGQAELVEATLPALAPGRYSLAVRCTNTAGKAQAFRPIWNPSGFMRSAIERTYSLVQQGFDDFLQQKLAALKAPQDGSATPANTEAATA